MSGAIKLKILHMIDTGEQGGAEQVLCTLLERLGGEQYEHHVFLPRHGWLHDKLVNISGINIVFCDGAGRFNLRYIRKIGKYLKDNDIQIVHSHLLGTSLYASLAGFFCRVPVVCTFHGYIDFRPEDRLQLVKLNIVGLCASRIVTVSERLRAFLVARICIGRRNVVSIYNGVEAGMSSAVTRDVARRSFGVAESDILIGSIGNVKPAKGYDVLIDAAKILSDGDGRYRFMIAGNTENSQFPELLDQRDRLCLQKKVLFLGFQEDTDLFLSMLDVFALPSYSEGFSLATIEAMSAGIPVVVTNSGGPQEIIVDGYSGVLVNAGDANALAKGIQQVIADPMTAANYVENAKSEVITRFSAKLSVTRYEQEYRRLSSNKIKRFYILSKYSELVVFFRKKGLKATVNRIVSRYFTITEFLIYRNDPTISNTIFEADPDVEYGLGHIEVLKRYRSDHPDLPREFYVDETHGGKEFYLGYYKGELAQICWVFRKGEYSRFFKMTDDSTCELNYIINLPAFRGKGLPARFINFVSSDLLDKGLKTILMAVSLNNSNMTHMMTKTRFKELKKVKSVFSISKKITVNDAT